MMFYPQPMTEVEMIVPASDILPVTKAIRGQGVFHQIDGSSLNPNQDGHQPNQWQDQAAVYNLLERRIQAIMQSIGLKGDRPGETELEGLVDVKEAEAIIEPIEQEVKNITDQLYQENKRLEQLKNNRKELEPVATIDLDVSAFRHSRYMFSMLGTMPSANIERMKASLTRVPYVFLPLHQDHQNTVVWLAGTPENADILERSARSAYLIPLQLPEGYQGTPAQVLKSLATAIDETQHKITKLNEDLHQLGKTCEGALEDLLWKIRPSRMLTDAILRYSRLSRTYIIVGWVPTASMDELSRKVKQASKEAIISAIPQDECPNYEQIPVALSNSRLLKPFKPIMEAYGRPRYDEIDPTPLIAVTFPLLFGAMFGDVGQGALLVVLGWLIASRKVKALNSLASLGGLIAVCGGTATIFGFLYGSFFGIENVLPALWLRPMDNIMTILIVAIAGGIVLLSIGFLIGMYNAIRSRNWGRLFFDHNGLAGFILYWSLIGLIVPLLGLPLPVSTSVFAILVGVTGVVILFSEPLKRLIGGERPLIEGGIGTYAIQSFFELFETLIGFLSNSLSYVRVGAFAVAHAGLSAVIFVLAQMFSPDLGIVYWLIVVLGNLFIVGFEGLIVGIQTMRLEYYEFFSKFFTGGGMRYNPLGRVSGD